MAIHSQINQAEILDAWVHSKQIRGFYRLGNPQQIAFEYAFHPGPRIVYGFLKFECEPAGALSFYRTAIWPETLPSSYQLLLDQAIVEGIVDALYTDTLNPYSGCKLICVELKWDNISSSEWAFYQAARRAMLSLRDNGKWEFVPKPRPGPKDAITI